MDLSQISVEDHRAMVNTVSVLNVAFGLNVAHELQCTAGEHEQDDFTVRNASMAEVVAFLIWESEALSIITRVREALGLGDLAITDAMMQFKEAHDNSTDP